MNAIRAVEAGNPGIRTASHSIFTFLTPDASTVRIADIAAALSRICRYTGQLPDPDLHYSVAQHSVMVSHMVPKQYALWGLMHDAAEAYIGDVSSPLKSLLQDYRLIEHRVEECVWAAFGLMGTLPTEVKKADHRAYIIEKTQFFDNRDMGIVPMERQQARVEFLERAAQLGVPL